MKEPDCTEGCGELGATRFLDPSPNMRDHRFNIFSQGKFGNPTPYLPRHNLEPAMGQERASKSCWVPFKDSRGLLGDHGGPL